MGSNRSDLGIAIEEAYGWCAIIGAIDFIADSAGTDRDAAWSTIKKAISLGALAAQCIDDHGERIEVAPHWIELLAQFQLPSQTGISGEPVEAVLSSVRFTDFPEAGVLWFDRRRAAESRLARNTTSDNRAESSLPPTRVRDVVVSRAALEKLTAPPVGLRWLRQDAASSAQPLLAELIDPVPLGRVYGHKEGPNPSEHPKVAARIETITRVFESGGLAVYGRRRAGLARERVSPADHEIDWTGKPTDTDDYCSVCAFRRGLANWTGPRRQAVLDDVFEDLAIARSDWNRIERAARGFSGGHRAGTGTPTPHRFDNPAWEMGDVFGWVLDRDPSQFGRIFTGDDWRSASFIVALYSSPAREPRARTVLLHALQRGDLIARDRAGGLVPADWWLARTERDLPARGREFLFRRDEVLRLWPELKPDTSPAASNIAGSEGSSFGAEPVSLKGQPVRRRPGPAPVVGPNVQAQMRADITQGRITRTDLLGMKQVEMQTRYKASADTCRRARSVVLSELGEIPEPANSGE